MNSTNDQSLLTFFTMIADPVRLQILQLLLKEKRMPVSELINRTEKPQSMVSYHLGCLKDCGLVIGQKSSKDARVIMYSLHEPDVVERIFLLAENFLLKHEICKNHPVCLVSK